ncbi:transcriptional regulator, LysR family [Tistlia consotensis]|uniref:Transcriptional regulator, LysR family n=1 Tax=Tistlia consotensis USBA 355 TaxID=560819 RepID=A0A1Y6CU04_9PROT|nr:LysR substrate-binding domain-containing protein [Tistlia consotensis]SMF77045.1 transcriptional regulator, LysR family [Tistlia consotensis USBA 355]SNS13950.1 transcriptional regulator, LysR family [Tistlia consotensis]
MSRPAIRQIEAFNAVMELGSVTRAGEAMYISQPAVSKLIKAFEERCGFPLFARRGGRLVPTREARQVFVETQRLFSGADRVFHTVGAIRDRRRGEVSIAAFAALSAHLIPAAVSPFLAARPDVHFELYSRTSNSVPDMVQSHRADYGLSLLPTSHPTLECREFFTMEMVCVLRADSPLAEKRTITARDLADVPLISLSPEDRSRLLIDEAFHREGVAPRTQIQVQIAETACSFVANGGGGASIVTWVNRLGRYDPRIAYRRFEPRLAHTVWLIQSAAETPSRLATTMVELIRDKLVEESAKPLS